MSPFGPDEALRSLERFTSGGKEIRVETFAGGNGASAPSIIVLHGATGVEFANRFIAILAHGFATQGFVVHLVHYFDRTGAHYANDEVIRRSAGDWLKTIDDAVQFVRNQRPEAAIGIFGYSLGGYLAAAETVNNDQISAAVILSGGIDEASARNARHAAPMLIIHGAADTRVPVSEAHRLEALLKQIGAARETCIYPGEGHLLNLSTYVDVVRRGTAFFQARLNAA